VEGGDAIVEIRGKVMKADASLVVVKPGDFVVIYGGAVVDRLEPEEAQERLRLMSEFLSDNLL